MKKVLRKTRLARSYHTQGQITNMLQHLIQKFPDRENLLRKIQEISEFGYLTNGERHLLKQNTNKVIERSQRFDKNEEVASKRPLPRH